MQINPGLSITQVSTAHVQIGSGFRALELTGISPPIEKFLANLRQGIIDGKEFQVAQECGLNEFDYHVLLSKLRPVLVSTPNEHAFVYSTDPEHRGSLARLDCVTPIVNSGKLAGLAPQDRQTFQAQRHTAALQIFGLGRTGVALTSVLQQSGVGHLNVWDAHRVAETDLGTGLQPADIGQLRSLATATALNPRHRRPTVHPTGWLKQPVLSTLATIHFSLGGLQTDTIALAKQRRHPYLPVVIRDDEIDIGPWVLPQARACPVCLETAAGVTDTFRNHRNNAVVTAEAGIETVAGAHLVAGLIATDLLTMIDSQPLRHQVPQTQHGVVPGRQLDTFTRIQLANGWVQTFRLDPVPGCCLELQDPKIANTSAP